MSRERDSLLWLALFANFDLCSRSAVDFKMQEIKSAALHAVENALRLEQELYFTQNSAQFNVKRDEWLSRYKEKRRHILDEDKKIPGQSAFVYIVSYSHNL